MSHRYLARGASLYGSAEYARITLHKVALCRHYGIPIMAKTLLTSAKERGRSTRIELLADNEGLALLRSGSPYAQRIEAIATAHGNIKLLACETETDYAAREEGSEPELIPDAQRIDDALTEISERLNQGWTYVRH